MQPVKRHKRSGSAVVAAASPSAAVPRSTKRYTGPRPFGKFQKTNLKPEKKNFDTDIVAAGLLSIPDLATATTYCLNLFNAGTSANAVTGRQVALRSLQLKMSIREASNTAASTAVNPTTVRVLVVYDRQPSGTVATAASILGSTTFGASSFMNLSTSDRYTVLISETLSLTGSYQGATVSSLNYGPTVTVDRYVKVRLPTEAATNAFTGTIGGLATGSIVLLCWCDNAAAAGPPIVMSAASRVRFTDA